MAWTKRATTSAPVRAEPPSGAQGSLKTGRPGPAREAWRVDTGPVDRIRTVERRRLARDLLAIVAAVTVVTVVAAIAREAGLHDASPLYLLAVVAVAVVAGTWPAVATAVAGFLTYDLLFVEPRFTLTVDDPQEWLNLLLLLLVGIVVGRLAGRERDRAETAIEREREATAMFRTSFELANGPSTIDALPVIADVLADALRGRVWIEVSERTIGDSGVGPRPVTAVHAVLSRRPGDQPAVWTRVHAPGSASDPAVTAGHGALHRVAISAGDRGLGAIWVERQRADGAPTPGETRLLAAAADQIGRSLERDGLAADAAAAEVARRSDVLKSALLDSVSHDLRTPLAAIRAAAGTLMDPAVERSPTERRAIAAGIDAEAERLNRLVSNLLDMSRIEAGELHPTTSAFVLDDLVEAALRRSALGRARDRVTTDIPADLPPVEVDEVLFDQVLANLFDNVDRHAGAAAAVRIGARSDGPSVILTVEDGGPGVPDDALPRLFDKFYRAPRHGEGARRGTGAGLAVVRGLVDALDGAVTARRSEMGGLAIDCRLPGAATPRELEPTAERQPA